MNTGRHINRMGLALAFVISAAGSTWATELPPEPSGEYLVNEDVNIVTGLYTREYSLARNGIVDYMTARQIVSSEYNEYWNTVVETVTFPLFYWSDMGQTGHFRMWVDRKVEGCACDILPYTALNER